MKKRLATAMIMGLCLVSTGCSSASGVGAVDFINSKLDGYKIVRTCDTEESAGNKEDNTSTENKGSDEDKKKVSVSKKSKSTPSVKNETTAPVEKELTPAQVKTTPTPVVVKEDEQTVDTVVKIFYAWDSVNMRSEPEYGSTIVTTILDLSTPIYYYGETEKGYGSDGELHDWHHVSLENGASGWIRADLLSDSPNTTLFESQTQTNNTTENAEENKSTEGFVPNETTEQQADVGNVFYSPTNYNSVLINNVNITPGLVYYNEDGSLTAECFVINGYNRTIYDIVVDSLSIYDANDNMIASASFGGLEGVQIGSGGYITYTFVFPADTVCNPKAELASGLIVRYQNSNKW